MIDEIEPGRATEDLLSEADIAPDRAGAFGAAAPAVPGLVAVAARVVVGFLTAASEIEARGFAAAEPPPDFREETEPEGEMTEERLGTALPDSTTALLLVDEPREVRDVDDGIGFVPAASEVRRVGVAPPAVPEAVVRVVEGAAFDIVEVLVVFFEGEEVIWVVPAGLVPVETVLVVLAAGF